MRKMGGLECVLDDLPYNKRRVYVEATDWTGTKIYMPVDSDNPEIQIQRKMELQAFLDSQVAPVYPLPPRTA
jgi:hypothetical protein